MEQLLATKLFIPSTRPKLVSRFRLTEKLSEGLHRKLTLISAPAGFGKTTLITEWLGVLQGDTKDETQTKHKTAWLSLDENDNDTTRFLTYFATALNQLEGTKTAIGGEALSMLQSPQPPPEETILTSLMNEMAAVPDKIIFTLDDYHLIEAQPVHDALTFLLENIPPQLRLVIITREDPLLPLSRLRARDQLTELRAADLRFTTQEAAEFLNQVMGLNLSKDDIAALETRTEGWVAGLQLAAISLRGHADTSELIQSFTGSNRLVLDYLIEEVLDRQPKPIQNFLLKTAILDRLTGSLCDALSGQDDGQQILEVLERANLFIVPLDNERRWYRYHHLFADLLKQRLQHSHPDQIPSLYLRASAWYQQMNLLPDAIRHARSAKDFNRVADLAELVWPRWNQGYQAITWFGWVKELPEELVHSRPVLCVACAQALLNAGQLEAAEDRLQDAERWLEPANDQTETPTEKMVVADKNQFRVLPAMLAATRAYHAQASGNASETVKYVERALELFPEDDHYNRASATGFLGLAHWTNGNLEAACRIFTDGLFQNAHDWIKGTFILVDMQMTLGHLREADRISEQGLKLAKEFDPPNPIGTEDVYSGISYIHREQGDLDAAARDLEAARSLGEQVELPDWQHRWCIAQARLKETQGDLANALDLLDQAERLFVRTPVPDARPIAAMKARVFVKQGKLSEAAGWAQGRSLSFDDELNFMREFEHITLARVLIAQHKKENIESSIQEAMGLLERLLNATEEAGRMGNAIEILLLKALALDAQGDISQALTPLEHALTLAEPEGYSRIFVDEGKAMFGLLSEALSRGISPGYVRRLLEAFPKAETKKSDRSKSQALIDPLSDRELEILQLLAEGRTNPEIASELYLSLNTVKAHTRNIYGKLGVNNRTQAGVRARDLGILPPG